MARRERWDDQWKHIKDLLPGKASDPGRTATDTRTCVEAVLWIARTGAQWRDLPERVGAWHSVFPWDTRRATAGVGERVVRALSGAPDFEYVMLDSTLVRAHQPAAGAQGAHETEAWAVRRAG